MRTTTPPGPASKVKIFEGGDTKLFFAGCDKIGVLDWYRRGLADAAGGVRGGRGLADADLATWHARLSVVEADFSRTVLGITVPQVLIRRARGIKALLSAVYTRNVLCVYVFYWYYSPGLGHVWGGGDDPW